MVGHITFEDMDQDQNLVEENAKDAPFALEEGNKATVDELKEVNLRTMVDFPLPIIEIMVEAITGYELLFFMDGSSSYNQIPTAAKDAEATTFRTPKVVKSKKETDHIHDLRQVFQHLRKFQLKMNPLKCAFEVSSGKFLGFIVRHQDHQYKGVPHLVYCFSRMLFGSTISTRNDEGKENPLYYLSRTLTGAELNYSSIEKMCLALIVEITYIPQRAIKGQALANFLANHPNLDDWKFSEELPDEEVFLVEVPQPWIMFFNGASSQMGGARVVLITLKGEILPFTFNLVKRCSNNVAEYQDLIRGLEMTIDMDYALANLASTLALLDVEAKVPVCKRWVVPPMLDVEHEEVDVVSVYEVDKEDWRQPLINYLEHGKSIDDPRKKAEIRWRASRFINFKGTLYRRSFDVIFLRCLGEEEANKALEEAHSSVCGAHQSGQSCTSILKGWGTIGQQ
ncbi:uncharacterized protein LOC119370655 [Jatropha curcas]|uniref:uncharacterized protein LOC119370655 n=1 Tax=Jatropha curcas TaxID=180498 RepID=UPI001893A62D|nr:uncharacterized protein LOC119370655 [Jatropha curcas]